MGSLGIGEIVLIAAVMLIIFGPDRLPEIARKGAEIIRKSRAATAELTGSLREEYGDVIAPLNEVREELKSVQRDLTAAATSITDETSSLSKDLTSAIDPTLSGDGPSTPETGEPPKPNKPIEPEASSSTPETAPETDAAPGDDPV